MYAPDQAARITEARNAQRDETRPKSRARRGSEDAFAPSARSRHVHLLDLAAAFGASASVVAGFFSRHVASCLVRRAFCFLRFGESWGVVMRRNLAFRSRKATVRFSREIAFLLAGATRERRANARSRLRERQFRRIGICSLVGAPVAWRSMICSQASIFASAGPSQSIFAKRVSRCGV